MALEQLDSTRLIYHPREIAKWLSGGPVYPINMEVCLSGACNHRCVFCCVDYIGYKPVLLEKEVILKTFEAQSQLGLKSILFAGTGEPLTHPEFIEIVNKTRAMGVRCALSTNGVLFTADKAERCLKDFNWIRFSTSAGTEKTYKKIQRGRDGDFERVIQNIHDAAEIKKKQNLDVDLGVQIVLMKENIGEVMELGRRVRDAGADMYYVKGYGIATGMLNRHDSVDFSEIEEIKKEVEGLSTDTFRASARIGRSQLIEAGYDRGYEACHAAPFHAFIEANGNVCPCCNLAGMPEYCFGNINETSFQDLWDSDAHSHVMKTIREKNMSMCIPACKLDVMNRYLDKIIRPDKDVDFI